MERESDHKPFEAIAKKLLASAPPRLQRILLGMQKYDYMLEYKPGKELILPDMLSKEMIKFGWPETKSHTPTSIQNVKDELSEIEGVILKNDRILVPSSMRKEILQRIHQGDMGIEKSKRRARDVLY